MSIESDLLIVPSPEALAIASELRVSAFRFLRRLRSEHPNGTGGYSQMSVLIRIHRFGPTTLSALAAADGITPQSMARTVGDLVDEGLLAREPDPNEGRLILPSLTDRGTQKIDTLQSQRDGWLAVTMLARLSPEEREMLRVASRLLDRLSADENGENATW